MRLFFFIILVFILTYFINPSLKVFKFIDVFIGTNLYVLSEKELVLKKERDVRINKLLECEKEVLTKYPTEFTMDPEKLMTINYLIDKRRKNEIFCIEYINCINKNEDKKIKYISFENCLERKELRD